MIDARERTTMKVSVAGKVALITGGSSGIGRVTAEMFAREGARVIVADVDDVGGEQTVDEINGNGGEATFVAADVTHASEVEMMVKTAVERFGRLDCAFNNAGIGGDIQTTVSCSEDFWDRMIATNLKGVWLCMKYELEQMARQGSGAIVNTSSVAGLIGFPGFCAYVAAKHGVNGLTKTAALEFAKSGIRVNAVCPGAIRTPMFSGGEEKHPWLGKSITAAGPMRRLGDPSEIAEAVVWLCSDAASFVTGLPMAVDGGWVAQ